MENKLDGLAETLDALKAMGVEVKSKKLQNLLKKSSAPIIATAKSLVPVDTGDLRDSIGFINSKDNANFDKALIGLRLKTLRRPQDQRQFSRHAHTKL